MEEYIVINRKRLYEILYGNVLTQENVFKAIDSSSKPLQPIIEDAYHQGWQDKDNYINTNIEEYIENLKIE